jgi:hypothetical protein
MQFLFTSSVTGTQTESNTYQVQQWQVGLLQAVQSLVVK